jgi:hypothetical protein
MIKFKHAYFLILAFVAAVFLGSTSIVYGGNTRTSQDAPIYNGDALLLDAKNYAIDYGVSLDEALRRLQLQEAIGELNAELYKSEQATFAGLWVEHTPQFRVVVQFTEDSEDKVGPRIVNGPLADIVEVRRANTSLSNLEAEQTTAWLTVRDLGVPLDHDINVFQNRVELYVTDPVQLNDALKKAQIRLPEHVVVIKVEGVSRETTDIYGGLALSDCTSGFSVKNTAGTIKGIITAGHCNNTLSYNGSNLPYQSGIWSGSYDVQWHTAPSFTVRNWVWDGSFNRYIYGQRHYNNQYVGDYVCKFGKNTLGGCGNITSKNFNGTYIRVHSDSVDLSEPGDSGGPWFSGTSAFGIMTGDIEPGNDAYYMPINYISVIGVNILTN